MARLTTIVCALSAVMTIVDYFTAKSFFADWLARHLTWTESGCRISPTLNGLVIVGVLSAIWLATGYETKSADELANPARSHWQAYLIGCFLFLWFVAGPPLAGPSTCPVAEPTIHGPEARQSSSAAVTAGGAPGTRLDVSAPPGRLPLGNRPPPPGAGNGTGSTPAARQPPAWRPGEVFKSVVRSIGERILPPASR